MPFTMNIIPHIPSLDMYGSPRSNTAYSLSGELVLAVSSVKPGYVPQSLWISSLAITFEGKTVLASRHSGFVPYRLCSVKKEMVTGDEPIMLTNAGIGSRRGSASSLQNGQCQNDPAGTMRWTMTFDLQVPGWLPPTLGNDEGSGCLYTIHASAKFHDDRISALASMAKAALPDQPAAGLSAFLPTSLPQQISSLFTRSKSKTTTATPIAIQVNRFRAPKSLNPFSPACGGIDGSAEPLLPPQIPHPTPSLFPVTLGCVETRVNAPTEADAEQRIPIEILSGIEVVAGIPEFVGLSEDKIPFSLRLRSNNKSDVNKGLVLEAFDVEVEQTERFRTTPCDRYINNFPVPPISEQPPNKPFLTPHPLETFYDLGLGPVCTSEAISWTRRVPMVQHQKVNYRPAPITGGLELDKDWAKMDLTIGVLRRSGKESSDENQETSNDKEGVEARRKLISADFDSPFMKIRHEVKVAMKLSWLPADAAAQVEAHAVNADARRTNGAPDDRTLGDLRRSLRLSHPARRSETLMFSIPMRIVQVSEQVEKAYRVCKDPSAVAARRAALASAIGSRPATPSSESSSSHHSSYSFSSSRSTTPSSSARSSPLSITSSLPCSGTASSVSVSGSSSVRPSLGHEALQLPSSHPYASLLDYVLPPYSVLYHSNGDRKELEVGWLPKYTERTGNDDVTIASSVPDLPTVMGLEIQL